MLVTARTEYACLAMIELALRYPDPKPIPLNLLTKKQRIPSRFLVQILLDLKTAGLVHTTRGSSGGYKLAKPPDQISLADIVNSLDGLEEPEVRTEYSSPITRELHRIWKGLGEAYTAYLNQFHLSDLISKKDEVDYII